MTSFADNFWGGKNNGFFVLYHNMKHGQTSTKELVDFLRESCSVEESYNKLLNKLAKAASNNSQVGTFCPFWQVLKTLVEKLANIHMQLVHTWSDLIKDIARYSEDQHKRHRSMKEGESGTQEVARAIQDTTTALHKAKELYHTRCLELEKLKRENGSQKDIERSETRYKRARDEYKNLVEKYATIRNNFQQKMGESCRHFQELEEEHVCQMKDFVDTYSRAWENEHVLRGQAHEEFRNSCESLTVQKLLQTFIDAKTTGSEKPGPLEFVEPDLSSLPPPRPMSPEAPANEKRDSVNETKQRPDSSGSPSPVLADQPGPLSRSVKLRVSRTWFLKSRNKREKKKKKKKDNKEDSKDSESIDTQDDTQQPEVDEEGYRIRPPDPDPEHNGDKNSWYSSDSGSDSDGDIGKKLKVEIKPLSSNGTKAGSGNVDDIRTSVNKLRLSPTVGRKGRQTPTDKKMMMKRSQSESDTLDVVKPTQNLLNLDFFAATSSASTPTGSGYQLPSPMSPDSLFNTSDTSTMNTPQSNSNISDIFSQPLDASTPNSVSSATNSVGAPPIPQRPPSRTIGILPQIATRPTGRNSPLMPMSRSDSGTAVTFDTTSMPVGSSRGPSPLTIGMSDNVPLAVAFTETINAYFRGTDATKCAVKMTGNLMMSFPAGVVRVFTENPNPATLSFRIKNASRLEQVLLNKELLAEDSSQTNNTSPVYSFDMAALHEHLRSQGEQNKSASYFNIDILKYQVKALPGVESTPLPVVVYWKCEEKATDFRLDYRFNPSAISASSTLKNITVTVAAEGDVTSMQSLPEGTWTPDTKRAMWKLNDISEVSENGTQGCIRAKFNQTSGPLKPSTTAIQFISEGATLSGVEFELVGPGYRISLSKKRFGAGKYLADPDPSSKYA